MTDLIPAFILSPLHAQRPAAEQKELANKWNEMGTDEPGLCRRNMVEVLVFVCVCLCF